MKGTELKKRRIAIDALSIVARLVEGVPRRQGIALGLGDGRGKRLETQ